MSGIIMPRRSFLAGFAALVAAPAIVRAASLMPVRRVPAIISFDPGGRDLWSIIEWGGDLPYGMERHMVVNVSELELGSELDRICLRNGRYFAMKASTIPGPWRRDGTVPVEPVKQFN